MTKKSLIPVVLAASIALAGCVDKSATDPATTPAPATSAAASPSAPAPSASETTSPTPSNSANSDGAFADTNAGIKAIEAAEAKNGGKLIGLDREDSKRYWEIDVLEGSEKVTYHVGEDGSVSEAKRKGADQEDIDQASGAIPAVEAVKKAMAELGEGYLDECELDDNHGVVVYEMDFDDASGHKIATIEIDSKTGEITKNERK